MKYRLVLLFSLISICVFSQKKEIDSLENQLEKARGDSKIEILVELSNLYMADSPQKAMETAHKAYYYATYTDNSSLLSSTYGNLGKLHFQTSSFDSANQYLRLALKTCETNEQSAEILDNLGVLYKDLSNYDSALVFHNQALRLQQTLGNREEVATCYKNIGNVYMQMAKYDDALEYYNLSLDQRKLEDNQKAIASLYNSMSSAFVGLRKYTEALQYLNQAVEIQKGLGNKVEEAYSLNGIGNFYFHLKVYDKAQEYYTKSLEIRKGQSDKNNIAASLFNIATVHRDLGNVREALKYYNQALELRQQTDNKEAQALILNAIGGLYKNQKEYSKSIEMYEQALELNQKLGSKKAIASSYERLGMIYKDSSVYQQSSDFYDKAIFIYREIEDSASIGRVYNFYGNLCADKGDFNFAKLCYENAARYSINNELSLAYVAYNQGKLFQNFQNTSAISYYELALEKAKKCEEKSLIRDIYYALYNLKKEQNKSNEALSYYEQFVEIDKVIENDKNQKRIAEIEFESDIKVLEHQNEVQALTIAQSESKHVQTRIYLILLVTILLAIIVFVMLLYRQFKQKKQANALLVQKQQEVEKAYAEIKDTNEILGKKNTQIIESLTYAKRIQRSILPSREVVSEIFPQNFVFYMPKEIVSGDFYWMSVSGNVVYFAVVDCTGHGVPGGFMSMVGNTLLNQIVNEMKIEKPSEILSTLDKEVMKILRQNNEIDSQEDGMVVSLIKYDKSSSQLTFSGAGQKMTVVTDGQITNCEPSLFSIGGMQTFKQKRECIFEDEVVPVNQNTTLYLYSDGFSDQFGGEKGERFSSKRFEKMLLDMQTMDMSEQYIHLSKLLSDWMGDTPQLDDILVVGIKL